MGRLAISFAVGIVVALLALGALRLAPLPPGRAGPVVALLVGAATAAASAYALLEWIPLTVARHVQIREGSPFWETAADSGVRVVGLGTPMTFPPGDHPGCDLLCGFGVPDVQNTMGIWTLYTSGALSERNARGSGRIVVVPGSGMITTTIYGPPDVLVEGRQTTADLRLNVGAGRVDLETNRGAARLGPGDWSDWVQVEFRMSPILSTKGMVRFRLLSIAPELAIYMTPVQFVPDDLPPGIAISSPPDYAATLWRSGKRFATVGWPTATNARKDERIDVPTFRETLRQEFESERSLTFAELDRPDWRLLLSFFYAPDRASHLLWADLDPTSEEDGIFETYRWMDDLVGEVRRRLGSDPGAALFVVSDHGFQAFRKEVHLNAWLRDHGWLVLQPGAGPSARSEQIDWSRTRAHAIGLGAIRLNLAGREPQGIVAPEDAGETATRLAADLLALRDPITKEAVVRSVRRREDLYDGPRIDLAPDLQVGFEKGYRVGWTTTQGDVAAQVVTANESPWSGDHASVDPTLVPGVFFSDRRWDAAGAGIADVGPTVLSLLGVPLPPDLDGAPLRLKE